MRLKKLGIVMMGAVLGFGSLPLSASADKSADDKTDEGNYETKDETIYASLGAGGSLEDMYVVNTFHVSEPGEFVDYGDYTDVRNLSNLQDIKQTDDNKVHLQANKDDGEFYYQGDLADRPLPWNIDISYMLDGHDVSPDDLPGKDGKLELQIETSANDAVDPMFFKNYMLQISLTLDQNTFENIQAPDGTKAISGKDTQVTFTVMPEKEKNFIVSANVSDFEMDPINISATPASMPIDDPDLSGVKGDMSSLSSAIRDLDDGVGDLNSGIADLNSGAADLKNGSSDYLSGINDLNQSSDQLVNGSAQIRDTLEKVNNKVQNTPDAADAPDLSDLKQLPANIRDLAGNLRDAADGLDTLKQNYSDAYQQLDKAIGNIPDADLSDEFEKLKDSDIDPDVLKQLKEMYQAGQNAKGTYQAVQKAFDSVPQTLEQTSGSLRKMADNMASTADQIESGLSDMDQLDALDELKSGIAQMASQYESFHSGLVDYTDGVGRLANNYQDINSGIQGLASGASDLKGGASDLKNGTEELRDETSGLPSEMQDKVDEMMDDYDASDFEPQSFVSDKNDKIDVVQFTLSTEAIEKEAKDDETNNDEKAKDKGIWDRLLELFR
ncbi:hypothetical protein GCM10028778_00350 [Barrientosiimonas marina]|uniref:YhgE/Pip domain-containing protein n=1 Tax=Lentibacillus kimchii TaxID=1542911 RepID=A0ABW2URF5_9BACI